MRNFRIDVKFLEAFLQPKQGFNRKKKTSKFLSGIEQKASTWFQAFIAQFHEGVEF